MLMHKSSIVPAEDTSELPSSDSEEFEAMSSLLDETAAEARPNRRSVHDQPEERDAGDRRRENILGRQAEDLLAHAESELRVDEDYVRPDLPERPYLDGILAFLADPRVVLAGIVLTFASNAVTSILIATLKFGSEGGKNQLIALPLLVVLGVIGFLALVIGAVTFWTITVDTASGRRRIDGWPEANVGTWVAESFSVVVSLLLSAIPGPGWSSRSERDRRSVAR